MRIRTVREMYSEKEEYTTVKNRRFKIEEKCYIVID